MTSPYLQNLHKEIYEDFFQRHDLVLSTAHVFRRGHSIARGKTPLAIRQKSPVRMYCGITRSGSLGCSLKKITCYDQTTDTYLESIPSQVIGQKKLELLEDILSDILTKIGYNSGIDVEFLSEYPRGYGFGFMGILFTLLSSVIHVLIGKISTDVLDNYDSFMNSDAFSSMYELALYLDRMCLGTPSSGAAHYASVISHRGPLCMLGKVPVSDDLDVILEKVMKERHPMSENILFSSGNDYFMGSLADIFDIEVSGDLCIDYSVLSFGIGYDSKEVRSKYSEFEKFYGETYNSVHDICKKKKIDITKIMSEQINIGDVSTFLYMNILIGWKNILEHTSESHYIDAFIQAIIDSGMYNNLIERESKNMTNIYYWFEMLKEFSDEKIGIVPVSSGKLGGSFLCVMLRDTSRKTMDKVLKKFQELGHEQACFSYASRRDGHSDVGLRLEQHISKKVYSRYIKHGSVLFLGGDEKSYIGNHEEILVAENKGVILDKIYNKIYVDGVRLTHKDLCSQSGTIEIIGRLLDTKGYSVLNSELPISSYSKNKNEMVGKIILPFIQLLKKHYDIDLDLKCSGSLYDFQIKLSTTYTHMFHCIERLS